MSKQPRRHLSPQEKVAILKRHGARPEFGFKGQWRAHGRSPRFIVVADYSISSTALRTRLATSGGKGM